MNRLKLLSAALLIGSFCLTAPAYAGTGVSVSLGYSDYDRYASDQYSAPSYSDDDDDDAWGDSYRRPVREHRHGHGHRTRYYAPVVVYQPPRYWGHGHYYDRYDHYEHHEHDRWCHH